MSYNRNIVASSAARHSSDSWFTEQKTLLNTSNEAERAMLIDGFDKRFAQVGQDMHSSYGVNIMNDVAMLRDKGVMKEYKESFLDPILEEIRGVDASTNAEKMHLEQVADDLSEAWDQTAKAMVLESYNTTPYLPLSTLDFPALVKQYIKFVGKDIIPVQTAASTNIEQRIFTKYLVDNNTGAEYETPRIYFEKDEDGKPLWKKIYNAGRGYRINDKDPIMISDINAAPNKRYSIFKHLLDDDGNPFELEPTIRTRLSYDFHIEYVRINGKKVRLPGNGIGINVQTGGTFINGIILESQKLPVVDPETNRPTGDTVSISDNVTGYVDFVKGVINVATCGVVAGVYVSGYISNENNLRTIGFREHLEVRKFLISDNVRFQLPFTVEDFAEANANLNFNLYNRLVQELVTNQELMEDQSILQYLEDEFDKYNNYDSDVWNLESFVHTEYADLSPTAISPGFAGDPFKYQTHIVEKAIKSVIYTLCDRTKLDNLGFVIYTSPKAASLLDDITTWTVQNGTEIGGVQMNHAFGVITDSSVPIRVVASNRVDTYMEIPAYQEGATDDDKSREFFFKIVAYPMDKFHITYKHLRFAKHLTNSPENAGYQDAQNPGGQAVLLTTTSQYQTITLQGIQGCVICKNSVLYPDADAGLIK